MSFLSHFIVLFMEAAPWLLLGYLAAALIKVWLPADWLARHLGSEGPGAVAKAALFGAPLPLCSCGVLPAAMGLRRAGASKGATISFLVSTPETGVDSVAVSYGLLGPLMAIVRPVAALVSAMAAGLLAGRQAGHQAEAERGVLAAKAEAGCCGSETVKAESSCCAAEAAPKVESCCASEAPVAASSCCAGEVKTAPATSCCGSEAKAPEPQGGCAEASSCCAPAPKGRSKWRQGWDFAVKDLVDDSAKWLLIGLFFAALVAAYVPAGFLAQWGGGLAAMLVMILIGIPMYICATASTPIAAGLLLGGVSPGAVLVFLLAGPATHAAALGLVRKELGGRALLAYLAGVIVTAIAFGYLTNYLAGLWPGGIAAAGGAHELLPLWLELVSALLLAGLMLASFYRSLRPVPVHAH
ncbi:SO_0444 family Cu/Zn efflux transporter [Gallaecimonas kandeliae]|uniref:SO_0444 family Cu/Zn efflux transporter n=1 Tax=Gallaecimonas kandeliae TaxID=3029055 RepID=UPI002647656A|nr:SO_0444 family Cu/Zn efflux transporter [Gallaecimonas kandeliae]WKE66233.1 SO_0444 family Cu/Zn efflux transporter [Gallaecimonas kandeliae]